VEGDRKIDSKTSGTEWFHTSTRTSNYGITMFAMLPPPPWLMPRRAAAIAASSANCPHSWGRLRGSELVTPLAAANEIFAVVDQSPSTGEEKRNSPLALGL